MIGFFTLRDYSYSWNKLKSLYIGDMQLYEDLIQSILSGSPLLETLELNSCYGAFSRIDITSKSVKNLVFFEYSGYDVCSIKVNAPHIQSLTTQSYRRLHKFLLHDLSSLVKVKLDYKATDEEDVEDEMLKGILLRLRHVKELKIRKQCLLVLSCLEAKGFFFPPGLRLPDDSDSEKTD
ncbi:F-box/LRR-repeat protein 25-like protein [Tanacetum coccineum]